MIGIINYGSGNIEAIANIYNRLNIEATIISDPSHLKNADKLILPGVGAFDETMNLLVNSGLKEELDNLVLHSKIPILGICVGMQIMAQASDEGIEPGLGWIAGHVKKFDKTLFRQKPNIPHMGWNSITPKLVHPILKDISEEQGFYFVHSYYFECTEESNILATTDYGIEFSSAVCQSNIFGMQFHPEKSHSNGIKLLENFAKL